MGGINKTKRHGTSGSVNDIVGFDLISWIHKQWTQEKKDYKTSKDISEKQKILFSLATILRQYISSIRDKRGGIQSQFKTQANDMIEFLQKELMVYGWSKQNHQILGTILYARKHCGNIAVEGTALRKPVSAKERKKLEALTKSTAASFNSGLAQLDTKDADYINDLQSLGLVDDSSTMDSPGSHGSVHGGDNDNPTIGI